MRNHVGLKGELLEHGVRGVSVSVRIQLGGLASNDTALLGIGNADDLLLLVGR